MPTVDGDDLAGQARSSRSNSSSGVVGVHRDKVTSVIWTADGTHVISGCFDGTARIWSADIDLDDLKSRARARIFRSLTRDERRAHLLPVPD